jgi:ABC-type transport system substrate-binding protein
MPKSILAVVVTMLSSLAAIFNPVCAQSTLRVVMHSDLKIVDPIWTTAYITRNHGYMIYDTLFAMDADGAIKPQMVETYDPVMEKLRSDYTRATSPEQQRAIATAVQLRLTEHTQYVPLGQWRVPFAARKTLDGFVTSPVIVFWSVKSQ